MMMRKVVARTNVFNVHVIRGFAVVKKKGGKGSSEPETVIGQLEKARLTKETAQSDEIYRFVKAMMSAEKAKIKFSPEEMAEHKRIADIYNRETSKRQAREDKDIATKIWLQQAAIEAIPTERLKDAALVIDETPPPTNRPFPFFATPPIKGFDVSDVDGTKEELLKRQ
jgi:hypothetical protein